MNNIVDLIESYKDIDNNSELKKLALISIKKNEYIKSNLNISYSIIEKNIRLTFSYIIPRIDLIKILKENSNKFGYIKEEYNLDFINETLLLINAEEPNKIMNIYRDYLIEIFYYIDDALKFHETFFYYSEDINKFSTFWSGGELIGYGLIIKENNEHFLFINMNSQNILDSIIYKNYYRISNDDKNIFNEINDYIDKLIKEYIITVPTYNITGILPYTDIKIICMKYFQLLPLELTIISNYDDILKIKEKKIIIILRTENHISILLKIDNLFISFDSSLKHLEKYKEKILRNNLFELLSFEQKLQNSGACSFYSIKILEQIIKSDISNIKVLFQDGTFLIQLILEMSKFFILNNKKILISDKKEDINSWENKIYFEHKEKVYYIDDYFYTNKFIYIKSIIKNLNLKTIKQFEELRENEIFTHIINLFIKKNKVIDGNIENFHELYDKIDSVTANKIIENAFKKISQDEINKKIIDGIIDYAKMSIFNEYKNFKINFILDPNNIKFQFIEFSIFNNRSVFKNLLDFYLKNHNFIRLFYSLGRIFNDFCAKNGIKKFDVEEEDEAIIFGLF